jgi:glucose/arabinose dehydrogenase
MDYHSHHNTRTVLASKKVPGKLLVSVGSAENVQSSAVSPSSGISQIRLFDVAGGSMRYASGTLVGSGLRNSIGIAEHPRDGGDSLS